MGALPSIPSHDSKTILERWIMLQAKFLMGASLVVGLTVFVGYGLPKPDLNIINSVEAKPKEEEKKWTFVVKDHGKRHVKGLKKKSGILASRTVMSAAIPVPNTLDLRPTLSPILDQGDCGSCWAFSLTSTLTDSLLIGGKKVPQLSPQYLVDCAQNASGCSGGYFDAAKYLIAPKGAPLLSKYPYTGKDGLCKRIPKAGTGVRWRMLGRGNPTVRDIESYMFLTKRPVAALVSAGAGAWEKYGGGVYNGCEMDDSDHMVQIAGFDNEGAEIDKKGNLPPGKGIWIVRNSWGVKWGEQGWMRMKMTDEHGARCNNIAEEAAYIE